jgi:hypothetical protein
VIFGGDNRKWRVTLEGRDLAADKPFLQTIWVNAAAEADAEQAAIAALKQAQAGFSRVVDIGRHKSTFKMLPGGTYAEGRIYFDA